MLSKLKSLLSKLYKEIQTRFLNLRTVAGGVWITNGLVLVLITEVSLRLGVDLLGLVKAIGVGLTIYGIYLFLSKKK